MARVIWAPQAAQDLDNTCDYLARSSATYARTFAEQVIALVESIPAQPRLGAVVPEYGQEDLRERLFHNYRIIYRLRGEDVEVVTIVHGARRLPRTPPG
jgi:plasmid stabilization system protein ParE